MYSDLLEELISSVLDDGELSEQKRNIIIRRAEKDGEDAEEVLMVIESRLKKKSSKKTSEKEARTQKAENFGVDSIDESIQNVDSETKQAELIKAGEPICVKIPESVREIVLKRVKAYNKKAKEWGYDLIEYDSEANTLIAIFKHKSDTKEYQGLGLWKQAKIVYKDGYLDEDYKKILKLCGVL